MIATTDPEPDERTAPHHSCMLSIGQDAAGHWLVQADDGHLEGRFISYGAAMAFARSERQAIPGAVIEIAARVLVPVVSFAPVEAWEHAA